MCLDNHSVTRDEATYKMCPKEFSNHSENTIMRRTFAIWVCCETKKQLNELQLIQVTNGLLILQTIAY